MNHVQFRPVKQPAMLTLAGAMALDFVLLRAELVNGGKDMVRLFWKDIRAPFEE